MKFTSQRLLRWLRLRQFGSHSNNLACCDNPHQSQPGFDYSSPSIANATDVQNLDTRNKPLVNLSKQSSNNNRGNEQIYYLCEYSYEGEKWSIEIPAESWEDAKARLKRMAYAEVIGEIQATLPVEFGLWVKLWVWLRRGG